MVTKGIIKSIDYNGNTCVVRMPYFETVNNDEIEGTAIISNTPGLYNGYIEGDVVLVAFEDGHIDTPVVIGKLYLGVATENKEARGVTNVNTASIKDKADIPYDTTLASNLDDNVVNSSSEFNSLISMSQELTKVNNNVAAMDKDFGNKISTIVNDIDAQGTKYESELTQTARNINAKVSRKVNQDSNDNLASSTFGWNLTADDWVIYTALDTSSADWQKEAYGNVDAHFIQDAVWVDGIEGSGTFTLGDWYLYINGQKITDCHFTPATGFDPRVTYSDFLTTVNNNGGTVDTTYLEISKVDENYCWNYTLTKDGVKKLARSVKNGESYPVLATQKSVLVVDDDGLFVNGDGTFAGTITARAGHIGKFVIGAEHTCSDTKAVESGIYSDTYITKYEDTPSGNGIYLGTDGIKLGKNFSVNTDGNLTAKSGHIGKFNIGAEHPCSELGSDKTASGIYSDNYITKYETTVPADTKGVYVGTDGIKLGAAFSVDVNGKVTATDFRQIIGVYTEYAVSDSNTENPDKYIAKEKLHTKGESVFVGVINPPATTADKPYLWTRTSSMYNQSPAYGNEQYSVSTAKILEKSEIKYYDESTSGTTAPEAKWEEWKDTSTPKKNTWTWTWTKNTYKNGDVEDFKSAERITADQSLDDTLATLGIDKSRQANKGLYYGEYDGATTLYVNASLVQAEKLLVQTEDGKDLINAGVANKYSVSIAGFNISESAIKNGKTAYDEAEHDGVYLGTDGIGLGQGKFYVDSAGNLTASSAIIKGNITATSGEIGGCVINEKGELRVPAAYITDLTVNSLTVKDTADNVLFYADADANKVEVGGFSVSNKVLSSGTIGSDGSVLVSTGTSATISGITKNYCFGAGNAFGVDTDGNLYSSACNISGGVLKISGGTNKYVQINSSGLNINGLTIGSFSPSAQQTDTGTSDWTVTIKTGGYLTVSLKSGKSENKSVRLNLWAGVNSSKTGLYTTPTIVIDPGTTTADVLYQYGPMAGTDAKYCGIESVVLAYPPAAILTVNGVKTMSGKIPLVLNKSGYYNSIYTVNQTWYSGYKSGSTSTRTYIHFPVPFNDHCDGVVLSFAGEALKSWFTHAISSLSKEGFEVAGWSHSSNGVNEYPTAVYYYAWGE